MPDKKSKPAIIKTQPTNLSVNQFLEKIDDPSRRADAFSLMEMMREATGEEPVLWSNSIVGFGNKRYRSERSGREVDWLLIGFAPRKANFSLHLAIDINRHADLLSALGPHKTGVGCLYIDKLAQIDLEILRRIIGESLKNKGHANQ